MEKCQLINGSVSVRSLWAEGMARTHKPSRCQEHILFHNWEVLLGDAKREANTSATVARFDGYVEVSPGKWLLRDRKVTGKKSADD